MGNGCFLIQFHFVRVTTSGCPLVVAMPVSKPYVSVRRAFVIGVKSGRIRTYNKKVPMAANKATPKVYHSPMVDRYLDENSEKQSPQPNMLYHEKRSSMKTRAMTIPTWLTTVATACSSYSTAPIPGPYQSRVWGKQQFAETMTEWVVHISGEKAAKGGLACAALAAQLPQLFGARALHFRCRNISPGV